MALQVYVPASSCVTAFSCRVLLLLSTLKVEEEERKENLRKPLEDLGEPGTQCVGGAKVRIRNAAQFESNFNVRRFNHGIRLR